MRLKRIHKFTASVTKGLLPSQQATLAQMLCGLLVCRSLILAEIARGFQTKIAFPHNLKGVERFVSNPACNRCTPSKSSPAACCGNCITAYK